MIAKKIRSLLQPAKLPPSRNLGLWVPSILLPLFALGLWGYLENPDWLEATVEENASTGQLLSTDPNSPVTEADLSIEQLSEAAQVESLGDLLQQLNLPTGSEAGAGTQTAKGGNGQATLQEDAKSADAGKEVKPKPVVDVKNPFASAIQDFLMGGSDSGVRGTRDLLKFSPLISTANAMQSPDKIALQEALAKLNNPEGTTANPLSSLAATSASPTAIVPNSIARGQALPVAQTPSPTLVGQGVYIPGQMPSTLPGQAPVAQNSGFVAPNPGTQVYYPQQRGSGGYQVNSSGTTYSRERGSTGSIVTPQGIIVPRDRGSTGSIVTPQGTVYSRERGSTGFTDPLSNTATSTQTNSTSTTTSIPNNVPSPTVP